MIYTVTFNPAIDYVLRLDSLDTGVVNRSENEALYFGGKGINVSAVLRQLGVESTALGFTAGFTGNAIEDGLKEMGIKTDFVRLESGNSRINVKIKTDKETEINGQGPFISEKALGQLYEKLYSLTDGDILILAGSIPNSLPDNIYESILEKLSGKGIRFIVDAEKNLLLNVLKYKPFLIKPNNFELGEIFGVELSNTDEIIKYAQKLREMGAMNVLVSMAEKGSVLADDNGNVHIMKAPSGKAVNSVGAGDSMLAGFVAGYLETQNYEYAMRLGTAAGSATAFSEGLAEKNDIIDLFGN
ncbi:MAG: 1-phosphofructokinase [Clostridium sp.]|nr:1-phosphofructokinase [Clostridium sp.]MCM1547347.1 1-phosphofructokinase [Ruminococcus sp.]